MKKIIILIAGCLFWGIGEAQVGNFIDQLSSNQQLLGAAVEESILIFRQNYQLQDTTQERPAFYGRQGRPQFGTVYSVGVKGQGGYYATDRLLRPWEYDANFEEYRNRAQYVPVISKTEYRGIKDSAYRSLVFRERIRDSGRMEHLVLIEDSLFAQGLTGRGQAGVKEGWMILVVAPESLDERDSAKVNLQIYRNRITTTVGKYLYEIKAPVLEQTVIGGVYVVPEVTSPGRMTFYCEGLVEKIKDKWYVVTMDGTKALPQREENVLTPIPPEREETVNPDDNHKSRKDKRKNK